MLIKSPKSYNIVGLYSRVHTLQFNYIIQPLCNLTFSHSFPLLPSPSSLSGRRVALCPEFHQHGRGGLLPVTQRKLRPQPDSRPAAGVSTTTGAAALCCQRELAVCSAAPPLLGAVLHRQGSPSNDVPCAGRGGVGPPRTQLFPR